MSKEKIIEDISHIICDRNDCTPCVSILGSRKCGPKAYAERLYNAGYRIQKESEWEIPEYSEPQYKRQEYICKYCRRLMFSSENYCPNCGAKMKKKGI